MAVAQKYSSVSNWVASKEDNKFFQHACLYGWIDECTAHMKVESVRRNYRTKEECIASAQKYDSISNWVASKEDSRYYQYARLHGWIDECTAHMRKQRRNRTKGECIASAQKYDSLRNWRKTDEGRRIYVYAAYKGWLDDIRMIFKNKGK